MATKSPVVRAFQPSDVDGLVNRDGRQAPVEAILRQVERGPCFTAVADEALLACGGMMLPWPGLGIVWMIVSADAARYPVWLSKTTRRILHQLVQVHALHRVEALAVDGQDVNHRWLAWMGFSRERDGIARHYLADQRSMVRYEWIGV